MGAFAPPGRRVAEPGRQRINVRADAVRRRFSALRFGLLAPLPGGLVVWFLVEWLRGRTRAW